MNPLGLEKHLKSHPQVVLLQGDHVISEKLQLLSVVERTEDLPPGNETLYMEKEEEILPDDFQHEQHLVVREGEKTILFPAAAIRESSIFSAPRKRKWTAK